jgi:pilus assembly protein Flp/PilA
MRFCARHLLALRSDTRGVTALEYGIIAGWLAFVIVAAFTNFATSLSGIFSNVGGKL